MAGRGKGVRWPSLRRQMEQRWRLVSSSRRQSSRCHHEGKGQGTLKSRFKALTSGKDWDKKCQITPIKFPGNAEIQ